MIDGIGIKSPAIKGLLEFLIPALTDIHKLYPKVFLGAGIAFEQIESGFAKLMSYKKREPVTVEEVHGLAVFLCMVSEMLSEVTTELDQVTERLAKVHVELGASGFRVLPPGRKAQ